MGKFEGHAIPGSALVVLGLFHILQAAPFRSFRALRQSLFGVVAEHAALAIYWYMNLPCTFASLSPSFLHPFFVLT